MSVNKFFNNFDAKNEQHLFHNLTAEVIQQKGHDVFYLERTLDNLDQIYGQSDLVSFNSAKMIEMYIDNYMGFEGTGDLMAKFGLSIGNMMTFVVERQRWADEFPSLFRPREGDLIFFPLNQKCFQIMYTDKFDSFYQLGELLVWKMKCDLFEYSGERFNTGKEEIDSIMQHSADILHWAEKDDSNNYILSNGDFVISDDYEPEPLDDTEQLQIESNNIVDWSTEDIFGKT